MKKHFFLLAFLFTIYTSANIHLPKIFADDMILQRNKLIPIWGWADANEKIEVRFNKQIKWTKADKNGKWTLQLDSEIAGGPYELIIKGNNKVILKNVLVGEVWICSGQSNMAFSVNEVANSKEEISNANCPLIRHFTVSRDMSSLPLDDLKLGNWEVCSPISVGDFSAVGYFFAKKIYEELKIPIGLINTSWGGTVCETWTSREGFESSDEFKDMIAEMPHINLDSISKVFNKIISKRVEILQGSIISESNITEFKDVKLSNISWPEMNEPELWESQALGEFDGVVWLRKTIQIATSDTGKPAILELTKIDDEDITFVNGIEVGRNPNWDGIRKYNIPAGILKEGDNTIVIRVVDNGGGGGIYGEASDFRLTIGDHFIPLSGKWKYQVESVKSDIGPNSYPSLLYNAMVNPLIPYSFQGVLWYQGESNAGRAFQYRKAFPLLIEDWRKKWNQGNFPFYFVQLSSFNEANGNSNDGSTWAELRESQTQSLQLPNTAMCVTTDIGIPNDIHPTNKQDVGKRLAAIALNSIYNIKCVSRGPVFKNLEIRNNQIIVTFENCENGLTTPDKYGNLRGFEIAGKDKIFHYATAYISDNKVVIFSEKVINPIAIHFGWSDDASESNLYNKDGFPAEPFRTDDWKTITQSEKYKIVK